MCVTIFFPPNYGKAFAKGYTTSSRFHAQLPYSMQGELTYTQGKWEYSYSIPDPLPVKVIPRKAYNTLHYSALAVAALNLSSFPIKRL